MTTHPELTVLSRYAEGGAGLDDAALWSVESHLETCADCRARLAGSTSGPTRDLLDLVAARLDDALAGEPAPARPSRLRTVAVRRWLTGSTLPWLAMTAGVLLVALLMTIAMPSQPSLVLLLAPLAPLPAVAASWSRRADPAWELIAGTPAAGLLMLLRRTAGVLAVIVPVLAGVALVSGVQPGGADVAASLALTLLPGLGCTAATIALGGRLGLERAALAVGGLWAAAVIAPSLSTQNLSVVLHPEALPAWAVATVALAAFALTRTDDYRRLASRR